MGSPRRLAAALVFVGVLVLAGSVVAGAIDGSDDRFEPNDEYVSSVDGTESGAPSPPPDRFEPNDRFDTATPLAPGAYGNLSIYGDDVDFYAVDVTAGERLTVESRQFDSSSGGPLEIYGPDESLRAWTDIQSQRAEVSAVAVTSGTHYIRTHSWDAGPRSYRLNVSIEDRPDAFEPNDRRETAAAIEPGTHVNMTLVGTERDYFVVEADRNERITADFEYVQENGDLDAELLRSDGARLTSRMIEGTAISDVVDERGRYYIRVQGSNRNPRFYNMTVAVEESDIKGPDQFEPNDALSSASSVDAGEYDDLSVIDGERDYFAVDAVAGEQLTADVTFDPQYGALDLTLHSPQGAVLDGSRNGEEVPSVSTTVQRPGTYYVEVSGPRGVTNAYDLSISLGDREGGADRPLDYLDPNHYRHTATPLRPGEYTGLRVTGERNDEYVVYLEAGQNATVRTTLARDVGWMAVYSLGPSGTRDDRIAVARDNRTMAFTAPQDGFYQLDVAHDRPDVRRYDLLLVVFGGLDTEGWIAHSDRLGVAAPVEPGTTHSVTLPEDSPRYLAVRMSAKESLTVGAEEGVQLTAFGPAYGPIATDEGSVTFTADQAGVHYVELASESGKRQVEVQVGERAGEETPIPGFGVGTALLSVVGAALVLVRGRFAGQ